VSIIPKCFLKFCVSNAEGGWHFWDDSEQTGDGTSSSENKTAIQGSQDELSD
jgi:hypothetical protein